MHDNSCIYKDLTELWR